MELQNKKKNHRLTNRNRQAELTNTNKHAELDAESFKEALLLSVRMFKILAMSVSAPVGQFSTNCKSSGEAIPIARTYRSNKKITKQTLVIKFTQRTYCLLTGCSRCLRIIRLIICDEPVYTIASLNTK